MFFCPVLSVIILICFEWTSFNKNKTIIWLFWSLILTCADEKVLVVYPGEELICHRGFIFLAPFSTQHRLMLLRVTGSGGQSPLRWMKINHNYAILRISSASLMINAATKDSWDSTFYEIIIGFLRSAPEWHIESALLFLAAVLKVVAHGGWTLPWGMRDPISDKIRLGSQSCLYSEKIIIAVYR